MTTTTQQAPDSTHRRRLGALAALPSYYALVLRARDRHGREALVQGYLRRAEVELLA